MAGLRRHSISQAARSVEQQFEAEQQRRETMRRMLARLIAEQARFGEDDEEGAGELDEATPARGGADAVRLEPPPQRRVGAPGAMMAARDEVELVGARIVGEHRQALLDLLQLGEAFLGQRDGRSHAPRPATKTGFV